jgi:hypothetical protein
MRHLTFLVLLVCAGPTQLFDGKTLNGWTRFGGTSETWGVEEGVLVGHGVGGGWLGTAKDYADFTLRLEFRLTPGANSGIYLRAPADTSHISRTGLEIQILDDDHPRYKSIQPWQLTGAIYHIAPPKRGHLKLIGQWNKLVVTADGPHITIHLNDFLIVDDLLTSHATLESEHSGLKRKTGRIGLQSHDGRVDFRGIEVEEHAAKK